MSRNDRNAVLHILNERWIGTDLSLVPHFDVISDEQIDQLRRRDEQIDGQDRDYFVERLIDVSDAGQWCSFVCCRC